MRRVCLLFLTCLTLTTCIHISYDQPAPKTSAVALPMPVVSYQMISDGNFKISFPRQYDKLECKQQSADSEEGALQFIYCSGASVFTGATLALGYNDYPPKLAKSVDFGGGVRAIVKKLKNGKLLEAKDSFFRGYPARVANISFETANGAQARVRAKLIFVAPRLYQLLAMSGTQKDLPAEVEEYFESFELVENGVSVAAAIRLPGAQAF